jgi:hypothetical protein
MSLAAGSKLGPYEIVEPLGAGRMGEMPGLRIGQCPISRLLRPIFLISFLKEVFLRSN